MGRIIPLSPPNQMRSMDSPEKFFADALDPKAWLSGSESSSYTSDWLSKFHSSPIGVARPKSAQEVAAIVQLCQQHSVTITPQGGNTGMVGGSVPSSTDNRHSIVLQMGRMNSILDIDTEAGTIKVESGVVLQQLHDAVTELGWHLPMHLGSQGSAQIGGLLSTNAGGSHVLRYGMMQDLTLGLEAVLPDGQIWAGDRSLLKDNVGYPLKRLFCGAEGTLGIITKAVLKLVPKPVSQVTALLSCESLEQALQAAVQIRRDAGELVSALEFMSATSFELLQQYIPSIPIPLEPTPAVALLVEIDTSSPYIDVATLFENTLEALLSKSLVIDGALATSEAQRSDFWKIREEIPEAQRLNGTQLKHDVAVPVSALPEFIEKGTKAATKILPGLVVNAFGHLGDGNVHFNFSPPTGDADFANSAAELRQSVYDLAMAHGGTISAEHGLGQDKVGLADAHYGGVERNLMRTIKAAIDPGNIMNPGKVV